jgi:hypothetical protein
VASDEVSGHSGFPHDRLAPPRDLRNGAGSANALVQDSYARRLSGVVSLLRADLRLPVAATSATVNTLSAS